MKANISLQKGVIWSSFNFVPFALFLRVVAGCLACRAGGGSASGRVAAERDSAKIEFSHQNQLSSFF